MHREKLYLRMVALILVILAVLPAYLWVYKLTGASAAPTILLGDKLIVNRAAYTLMLPYSHVQILRFRFPKRGDLVQIDVPGKEFMGFKRVIGLPGETIEMRDNHILINGRGIPVQPTTQAEFDIVPPVHHMGSVVWNEDGHLIAFTPGQSKYGNYGPITLTNNQYFLLGDNRDNSLDCREWGPVSGDHIHGKIIAIFHTGLRLPVK